MNAQTPLWLHIETRSDWAIGTGKGRYGSLDSMVARDADGLPYIPASTLKGMLRDASEQAALALDNGQAAEWSDFVGQLFGSQPTVPASGVDKNYDRPSSGLLRFGAARLGMGADGNASLLRRHLAAQGQGAHRLRQALTLVKSGVAIDRISGTASTDMLRFDEVARQGLHLLARLDLVMTKTDAEITIAFLQAACFLMDRIGSKRRRGLGQIEALLLANSSPATKPEAGQLRQNAARILSQAGSPPKISIETIQSGLPAADIGNVKTLRATYTLLSPVLAAASVEGNVVLSMDHLPGSMLLPAIKKAFATKSGKSLDAAIASGDLRVAPAMPVENGIVGVPAPACFERAKSKPGNPDNDRLFNMLDDEIDRDPFSAQKKGLGGGYIRIEGNDAVPFKVSRSLFTHNSILDETQRPDSRIGGVYVYEALSPGTQFVGSISLPEDIANAVRGDAFDLSIGRAKMTGYGQVRLTLEDSDSQSIAVETTLVRLLCGSDVICYGAYGQPEASADALASAIAEASGLEPNMVSVVKAALKARVIESWSVAAGLPRPSIVAVAAGSVAYVQFGSVEAAQTFADRALHGIGERRAEGFGQVLVNPSWLAEGAKLVIRDAPDEVERQHSELPRLTSADQSYAMAALIERAAWQAYIIDAVEALVADPTAFQSMFGFVPGTVSGAPSASQLGGLKTAVVAADEADVRNAVRRFLSRPEANVPANSTGPSTKMEEKLGRSSARALWNIATRPAEVVLPGLRAKLPDPPACLVSNSFNDAFSKMSDFAISTLILAGIQMHGRKRARSVQSEEVA